MVIKGLKRAVGEMPAINKNDGAYLQVSYNTSTGEVLTNYHVSFGHNSRTEYHDANIISVGMYDEKVAMAQLRRDIEIAVAKRRNNKWIESI